MKKIIVCLLAVGFAGSTLALDKAELDHRIRSLTLKFEAMQAKPDKCVPPESLRKAQAIILLDCTKGGLIVGFQGGRGVAMVRDPRTQIWSAPAFLQSNEGSLGFQIGGQQTFSVMLLMHSNAVSRLGEANCDFGGEARGTAGHDSAGAEGVASDNEPWVLMFDDRKGLYGGAVIKGGAVAPDNDANRIYYGQYLTVNEIVIDRKVQPTEAANALVAKIAEYANRVEKSQASARRE